MHCFFVSLSASFFDGGLLVLNISGLSLMGFEHMSQEGAWHCYICWKLNSQTHIQTEAQILHTLGGGGGPSTVGEEAAGVSGEAPATGFSHTLRGSFSATVQPHPITVTFDI